jgi:hypothetical protein
MITWNQFTEGMEEKEEKSGIDLDRDKEKGESAAHKAKIKKAKEENVAFFQARKDGARKIAMEAKAKGKIGLPTYWHFSAKEKPYMEIISAIKLDRPESFFVNKCKSLLSKIRIGKMKQQDFQRIMGELEVFGEAVCELFG